MKTAIIGYSGAGKSTLAHKLSEKYNVPVVYLDTVHWLPGWQERPLEQEQQIMQQFMDPDKDPAFIMPEFGHHVNSRRLLIV